MTASSSRLATLIGAFAIAISSAPTATAQCTLNGSPSPCALTGPITVSSGYTAPLGSTTVASDAITNNSDAQFTAGSGSNTILNFVFSTTPQGSAGTLTLNSGDDSGQVYLQSADGATLTNATNTVQGYGVIGNGGLSVVNGVGGTLLANVSGQTLLINGTGGLTNNGTLQANSGATLQIASNLTNLVQSGGLDLSGGNYIMNNGTIQISSLGTSGGPLLANTSAIVLNGPSAKLTDAGNNNALSGLVANDGSLSVLGGNQLSIALPSAGITLFNNYGYADIGTGSSLSLGSFYFEQDGGGITQVDGQLNAGGVVMDVGTLLTGTGQVNTSVSNIDSTVMPGDNGAPGTLTINGEYQQNNPYPTILEILIGSAAASLLDVNGAAVLGDELNVMSYNGFSSAAGQSFDVLNYTGHLFGTFSSLNVSGLNLAPGLTALLDYSHAGEILVDIDGTVASAVPEPDTLAMLIGGCGATLLFARSQTRCP